MTANKSRHTCHADACILPLSPLPACVEALPKQEGGSSPLTASPLPLTAQAGQLWETTVERNSSSLQSVLLQAGMGKAARHSAALPVTWRGCVPPLTSLCQ